MLLTCYSGNEGLTDEFDIGNLPVVLIYHHKGNYINM